MNSNPTEIKLADGSLWLWPDGSFAPVVRGGDGEDPEPDPDPNEPTGPNGSFTQADLKRIAAREKRDGTAKGRRDLVKELGLESEEDLKKLLDNHRAEEQKNLSEAEKAKKKAEDETAKAISERTSARQDRFDARCERALLKAHCPEAIVERAVRLVEMNWDTSEEVPDQSVFDEAVDELKKTMPQLFNSVDGGATPPPDSDPGSGKKGGNAKPTGISAGRDMLAARHPKAPAPTN
jgi:hypothetical protein